MFTYKKKELFKNLLGLDSTNQKKTENNKNFSIDFSKSDCYKNNFLKL